MEPTTTLEKFVTYSGNGFSLSAKEKKEVQCARASILSATLSPLEKAIFDVSIEGWKTVDRTQLAGWRCSILHPVTADVLERVDKVHKVLRHIALYRGPVTNLQLDAIVNAANTRCLGGGGVDGAIHAAAGPLLLRECAMFNGCEPGQCILTKGYQLPALYVLHTVGPIGENPKVLRSCYRSVFSLMRQNKLRTVGFCCVSTGVYGYPLLSATRIAIEETVEFLTTHVGVLDLVCFACFTAEEYDVYTSCLREKFPMDIH